MRPGGVAGGWPCLVVVGVDVGCRFPLPAVGAVVVDGLDAGAAVGVAVAGAGSISAPGAVEGVAAVSRAVRSVAEGVAGGSARAGRSLLGSRTGGVIPGSGTPDSKLTTTAPTIPSRPTVVRRTAVAASRWRPVSSVNTDAR